VLEDEEFRAFLKALGARIRRIRKAKNFDMRHIMITSGYYDAQWRKYETGGSLNLQSLLKIALTLDVPLDDLFDGLGQWPVLSVEEIETRGTAASAPSKPKVLPTKTRLSQDVAPKPGVLRKTATKITVRPMQESTSVQKRRPAK